MFIATLALKHHESNLLITKSIKYLSWPTQLRSYVAIMNVITHAGADLNNVATEKIHCKICG